MVKRLMFIGPHAIGKSTSAEKLAEVLPNAAFIPSCVSDLAANMGYDINKPRTQQEILRFQLAVLQAYEIQYMEPPEAEILVYDRSPMDFAIYAALETQSMDNEVTSYIEQCMNMTAKHCDVLIHPLADLTAPYEAKHNRPTDTEDQLDYRTQYDYLANFYGGVGQVMKQYQRIQVPVEHQFDARIEFIAEKLKGIL
jgi:hypothetical protein